MQVDGLDGLVEHLSREPATLGRGTCGELHGAEGEEVRRVLRRHVRGQPLGRGVRTPLRDTDLGPRSIQPLPEPVRQEVPTGLRELFESPERGEQVPTRPQETAADQYQHGGSDEIARSGAGQRSRRPVGRKPSPNSPRSLATQARAARAPWSASWRPPSASGKASAAARAASSASPSRPVSASARASRALASPVR